jgi:uncharacterized protein
VRARGFAYWPLLPYARREMALAVSLTERPGWYVIGAIIGLIAVGLLATINERVGVLGGYSNALERVTGRMPALGWKAWFLLGVLGGSFAFRLASGHSTVAHGYGWLTRTFTGSAHVLVIGPLLLVAGALIGFGAKLAGGCTSGNGIGGCSAASPSSFAATATFMGVAIAASFVIRAIT